MYILILIIFIEVIPCCFLIYFGNCDISIDRVSKKGPVLHVLMHKQGIIKNIPIEQYVVGVLCAEMPAEFNLEALKAQAVASRTYAYVRYKKIFLNEKDNSLGADVCTDYRHCQAFYDENEVKKIWGNKYEEYYKKIVSAVSQTEGKIITYENNPINPVFHSNSGGKTEDAEDVWGVPVAYLKSVDSPGEDAAPDYENRIKISTKDFLDKIRIKHPDCKIKGKISDNIKVVSYTKGGRVKELSVGNSLLKGTEIREEFSLNSTNIKFEYDKENIIICSIGNGHGVGLSQWGANSLANKGYSYEEILMHYYEGVKIENLQY